MKKNNRIIQNNNFTEFLLYITPNGKIKVEIFLCDETVWLTQKKISELFDVESNTITYHLKEIYESGEFGQKLNYSKNSSSSK